MGKFSMKKKDSDEHFIGIFDLNNGEKITGKGKFTWKDTTGGVWFCEGIFEIPFFLFFFEI